jgi:ComF family protein
VPFQLDRWLERFEGWSLPSRCVLCARSGRRDTLDLCEHCLAVLPVATSRCPRCAAELPTVGTTPRTSSACARCARAAPPYTGCHAAYRYASPIDALVQSLKYGKQLAVSRVLGELLARSVERAGLHAGLLVPVPLHPGRQAERGFNQALEIARWTARRLDIRCDPRAAVRRVAGVPQARSSAQERRHNLLDAFAADAARVAGLHVAILDDVVTTGSTVSALANTLLAAGAARADVWCIAVADPA